MVVQPAMAQSVLRDAETEAFFRDMSRPLKEAAGLQPDNVQIVLLHSDEINAFVAGGQVVYVFSGLVTAAESANAVQGVIARSEERSVGQECVRKCRSRWSPEH